MKSTEVVLQTSKQPENITSLTEVMIVGAVKGALELLWKDCGRIRQKGESLPSNKLWAASSVS